MLSLFPDEKDDVGVGRIYSEAKGELLEGMRAGVKVVVEEVVEEGGWPFEGSAMESIIWGGYGDCRCAPIGAVE